MSNHTFSKRVGLAAPVLAGLGLLAPQLAQPASAQETVKIGMILPMTGPSSSTGRQQEAAAKLGIIAGSVAAALAGVTVLLYCKRGD